MYEYENNQLAEQEINLPENNLNNSNQNSHKEYHPFYQTGKTAQQTSIDKNNDSYYNKTSPRLNYNYIENKKSNHFIPHHHHCIYHIYHHHHTPLHSYSTSNSRSGSYSTSPIKNISQPLINQNFNVPNNEPANQSKLMYLGEKENNSSLDNFNYEDIYKDNNYINNNNNSFIDNNEDANHWNALAFDEYMSKLAMNKYNKMKQYNESYYFQKQFGNDRNNNLNNIGNNVNNINEFNLMKKNLEEKYKLYNLITKYDEIKFKNINKNNKENSNENIINKNNKENSNEIININGDNYNQNINKEKIIENTNEINKKITIKKYDYNIEDNINNSEEHYDSHKKIRYYKNDENIKKTKKHHKKHNRNNFLDSSISESFPEKDNYKNIFIKDVNNRHKIQRTFNENIGQDNNNYIYSTFNHYKKNIPEDYNINTSNTDKNLNNSNLLEYLKKENEELKKLNNSYKQIIDTLFYFLNNISCKYQKEDDKSKNDDKSPKLFDLSKNLNNIEDLSKKLIDLERNINEDKSKNPFNKIINTNNYKQPLLLIITKENSIQLPEPSKLEQFNDLIEGMNEKCFSFKNENFIEKYKNNDINKEKMKNLMNSENSKKNMDQELIDKINHDGDRCVACLLGCNVSKRGYSPMRYNPYDKNVLRIEDNGDLLDKYNELRENNIIKDKENQRKNERNNNHKIPKSRDNSKNNSFNNSKSNSKPLNSKKKI